MENQRVVVEGLVTVVNELKEQQEKITRKVQQLIGHVHWLTTRVREINEQVKEAGLALLLKQLCHKWKW